MALRGVWLTPCCLRLCRWFATGPLPLAKRKPNPKPQPPAAAPQHPAAPSAAGEIAVPHAAMFDRHFDVANEFNLTPLQAPMPLITKRQRRHHRLRVQHAALRTQPITADQLTDAPLEDLEGESKVSAKAKALIHAALRGRQGFIGEGAVFPVALRRRLTFSTAATAENIRKVADADREVTLQVPLNGLGLSFQARRRLAALCPPGADGMLTIASERFLDQPHNEQRAKSILVQLVNEAHKADRGAEFWVEAVVKAPVFATQQDRLDDVTQKAVREEAEAFEMLQRWAEMRRESAVPVFADAMYTAYVGDKTIEQLLREKDAERKTQKSKQDDAGYTLL